MDTFVLLVLLHVIGFAYWLGTDLGVFYSSYFVTNEKLSTSARIVASKILFALDLGPRISMTMMLPIGIHLTWEKAIFEFSATVMAIIWVLSFCWLALVLAQYVAKQGRGKALLVTFDFWFRLALMSGLIIVGSIAQFTDAMRMPHWVAVKLIIYGALVGCGLVIRVKLRPFAPAFANLARGEASEDDNRAIQRSLGGTKPYVISIWIGLVISSALGLHLI